MDRHIADRTASRTSLRLLALTALAVGYDCGTWFVRSAAKDCVTISNAAVSGMFRRTYEVRSRHIDPAWNLVKVTRRGLGASNENVSFKLVEFGFLVKIW